MNIDDEITRLDKKAASWFSQAQSFIRIRDELLNNKEIYEFISYYHDKTCPCGPSCNFNDKSSYLESKWKPGGSGYEILNDPVVKFILQDNFTLDKGKALVDLAAKIKSKNSIESIMMDKKND